MLSISILSVASWSLSLNALATLPPPESSLPIVPYPLENTSGKTQPTDTGNPLTSATPDFTLAQESQTNSSPWNTEEAQLFVQKMRKLNLEGQNPTRGKQHSVEAIEKQKAAAKGRYSLQWFIDRHGLQEGTKKYEERQTFLKNRNLKKDDKGRFITE